MNEPSARDRLVGRWLHAPDEDTDDLVVFRPEGTDLPPARGRAELDLRPDGSAADVAPGRDDRPTEATGRWDLVDDDRLVVDTGAEGGRRVLQVVRADTDALVVRPEEGSP